MRTMISKYKMEALGIIAGAIAGWSYWYFVGCASGSCPITSSPVISTVYGAIFGALALSAFRKETKKEAK